MRINRLFIIIFLWPALLSATGFIYAQTPADTTVKPLTPLETLLASPAVKANTTAIYVQDLHTGQVLASHNIHTPLNGASCMKVVTIASLMHFTDISDRYHTRVYTAGRVNANKELEGNIVIAGSGDPTLNASCEPKTPDFVAEAVKAIQRVGIRVIKGDVVVMQDVYSGPAHPQGWTAADRRNLYGVGAYGFNFRRNSYGRKVMADPAGAFRDELYRALGTAGITVEHAGYTGGGQVLIFDHVSAPMDEIMRSCMMRSDNLFAECLLRRLATANNQPGSTEAGARQVCQLWRNHGGMDLNGVVIKDGSGLTRSNRLTAIFLARILQEMSPDPYYVSFFPLAGQEGTLRRFLRGTRLEAYIAMKTGSVRGVQAYAGYKLDENYAPTHVIVMIYNGVSDRAALRQVAARFLLSTF